jgi:hypothetical protein
MMNKKGTAAIKQGMWNRKGLSGDVVLEQSFFRWRQSKCSIINFQCSMFKAEKERTAEYRTSNVE